MTYPEIHGQPAQTTVGAACAHPYSRDGYGTLDKLGSSRQRKGMLSCSGNIHLVGMSKSSLAFLLGANQGDPIMAAATKTLPGIRVAIHASRFLGPVERMASRRANSMSEALVIPVC